MICVEHRYMGTDKASNMAVVSVKMVSGWIPEKESLGMVGNTRCYIFIASPDPS